MVKFYKLSLIFYQVVLGLTLPFYLLLYGASGHEFNPPTEDLFWMFIVIVAFTFVMIYSKKKERRGIGFKIPLGGLLIVTLYGGVKLLLGETTFDYDDAIGFAIRGLAFLIPLGFVVSNLVIFMGLFKEFE